MVAALLLIRSTSADVLPDNRADVFYSKYSGGGMDITGESALVRKKITENFAVEANYFVDKEIPAVKELLSRKPVSFPVLLDPANSVSKAYHVDEMPSSVIIDRKGQIRYIHRGYKPGDENDYQDLIRKLIRE